MKNCNDSKRGKIFISTFIFAAELCCIKKSSNPRIYYENKLVIGQRILTTVLRFSYCQLTPTTC